MIAPLHIAAQDVVIPDSIESKIADDSLEFAIKEPRVLPAVTPLVRNENRPFTADQGLEGRHIALWGSHGLYYELGNARWEWQRARLFQTVEDKFPTSFVLKYVTPMLENAGAVVMMPRERDINPHEVIVDNDGKLATSPYEEKDGKNAWKKGDAAGFAYTQKEYREGENPFAMGTYTQAQCVADEADASTITWTPEIPEGGKYAVYVSYKTLPTSATDAHYTVWHKGGKTTFTVNQRMGGGTWIYLGTFSFRKGKNGKVELSNVSQDEGSIVTADAVKFGGGMGNIARGVDGNLIYDNTKIMKAKATTHQRSEWQPRLDIPWTVSGAPRWIEGARYYLQWAGMPQSVYSTSNGNNDYTDDYRSRALWVKYLAGGSTALPNEKGLQIPIDLAFAFHTDGGWRNGNDIIGTLGIYHTKEFGGKLGDGSSCTKSRDLSNSIYNIIMSDVKQLMEPKWMGRTCVDKNYYEASQTRVPTMLLELMSHENFAEMRYGHDPRFKFVIARAIYKGMLRYMSKQLGYDYIVQPLPVQQFSAILTNKNRVHLQWMPTEDTLEPTAVAEKYIVYKRIGDGDFDNGTVVDAAEYDCKIPEDKVVSFRITALNRGGQSMPSETLSVGISSKAKAQPVLIVNGFDRLSAPDEYVSSDDKQAGFLPWQDNGVDEGFQIDYVGAQKEYCRSVEWTDDDSPGHGSSTGEYDFEVIAGNTFDYPALHGKSLLKAGYSFCSTSRGAIAMLMENELATPEVFSTIDVILGKEKQSQLGRPGSHALSFKTFDSEMQQLLTSYCKAGGRVFVSGAYVASDIWSNPLAKGTDADKAFAKNVLKFQWREGRASTCGSVRSIASPLNCRLSEFKYYNTPNEKSYAVESPDAIIPADSAAYVAFRYGDNGKPAGIVFGGNANDKWRTVVLGFPFETVKNQKTRDQLMQNIIDFLNQ